METRISDLMVILDVFILRHGADQISMRQALEELAQTKPNGAAARVTLSDFKEALTRAKELTDKEARQ